ncbi:MAG: exodeoxyribonuclease VII small subunit [Rickettsiaceae bacterium]
MPSQTKELSFEDALSQLESIVESIDNGNADLEQIISNFEKGVELKNHCKKKLNQAELKVQKIVKSSEQEKASIEDIDDTIS